MTIARNHRVLRKIKKLGAWVPHELSVNNKMPPSVHHLSAPISSECNIILSLISSLQLIGSGTSVWRNQNSGVVQTNKRLLKSRSRLFVCTLRRPYGGWWTNVIHFVLPQNSAITADLYSQHLRSRQSYIPETPYSSVSCSAAWQCKAAFDLITRLPLFRNGNFRKFYPNRRTTLTLFLLINILFNLLLAIFEVYVFKIKVRHITGCSDCSR